jgi:hypothetical protein
MDFNDGEIRFRTSLPLAAEEVTPVILEHLVSTNLFTVDHFYSAIIRVLHTGVSPKVAMGKLKGKKSAAKSTRRFELN